MTKFFTKKITYLPILFYNNTYKEVNQSFYNRNYNNVVDYKL